MLIVPEAEKVMRKNEDREIYIDEDRGGNLDRNEVLINTRREGVYRQGSLAALVTGSNEEFILPKDELDKYVTDGVITDRPDESWLSKNWLSYDKSDPEDVIKDNYIINEKFEFHHEDKPMVRLAKRALNPMIPIQFQVQSRSDKRRIRERIKEIENNDLSSKQFFKLMKMADMKVDCTVWTRGADRNEGITEIII